MRLSEDQNGRSAPSVPESGSAVSKSSARTQSFEPLRASASQSVDQAALLAASSTQAKSRMRERLAWATAAVLLLFGAAMSIAYLRKSPPELVPARFAISPPENVRFSINVATLAVSPDGRYLTFVASDLLFTPSGSGPIHKILAAGGSAIPITKLDEQTGETAHLFPHFLPDGEHLVFLAATSSNNEGSIRVGSLDSSTSKILFNARSNVYYAPPGYLLFARAGTLMAQPFDARSLVLTGDPFPVAEQVFTGSTNGRAAFSVSENGTLVYRTAVGATGQLTWFDRSGKILGPVGEPGNWQNIALSPDGKLVAVDRLDPARGNRDIWLLELGRNIFSRFTFSSSGEGNPVWAPDSRQLAFESTRNGKPGIYRKTLSGTEEELLLESADSKWTEDWSSDGRFIVYG